MSQIDLTKAESDWVEPMAFGALRKLPVLLFFAVFKGSGF
jgi:hypothetical protein